VFEYLLDKKAMNILLGHWKKVERDPPKTIASQVRGGGASK